MKKILTLGLAFMVLAIMPQIVSAQTTPSKEESKKEVKKASKAEKKEMKQVKNEEKAVAEEAPKKMTDSENQQQVVEEKKVAEEVKVNKNEPRPYVSEKIEKPKKEKPKTQHKVNESQNQ